MACPRFGRGFESHSRQHFFLECSRAFATSHFNYLNIFRSFLVGRTSRVRVGESESAEFEESSGGSALPTPLRRRHRRHPPHSSQPRHTHTLVCRRRSHGTPPSGTGRPAAAGEGHRERGGEIGGDGTPYECAEDAGDGAGVPTGAARAGGRRTAGVHCVGGAGGDDQVSRYHD